MTAVPELSLLIINRDDIVRTPRGRKYIQPCTTTIAIENDGAKCDKNPYEYSPDGCVNAVWVRRVEDQLIVYYPTCKAASSRAGKTIACDHKEPEPSLTENPDSPYRR